MQRIDECISEYSPTFNVGANSYGCPRILEWGEWPETEVRGVVELLMADNIDGFLEYAESRNV